MIIIQFERNEKSTFESIFDKRTFDSHYIQSRKLGEEEVLLQVIVTTAGIASPFILQFFKNQKEKKKVIKLIKKGVEVTFDTEDNLKRYLIEIGSKKK